MMLMVIFRNFANAPKNQTLSTCVPHCMTEHLVTNQSNTPTVNNFFYISFYCTTSLITTLSTLMSLINAL